MEEEDKKVEEEKLDMSKKPKEEISVFGLGVLLNHQKKITKQNEDIINILRHIENKVEALLDEKAQERLEKIKRRF